MYASSLAFSRLSHLERIALQVVEEHLMLLHFFPLSKETSKPPANKETPVKANPFKQKETGPEAPEAPSLGKGLALLHRLSRALEVQRRAMELGRRSRAAAGAGAGKQGLVNKAFILRCQKGDVWGSMVGAWSLFKNSDVLSGTPFFERKMEL